MKNLFKSSIILIIFTLVGRISGFARELVLAYVYGASSMSDAYIIGSSISMVIFASLGYGLSVSYIPICSTIKDFPKVNVFTSNLINISALFVGVICFSLIVFIEPLLRVLAVGFSTETLRNSTIIALGGIITVPFLCVLHILVGYLNIKGNFVSVALQSIIANIIIMLTLILSVGDIYLLALGIGLSNVFPSIIIYFWAKKTGFKYKKTVNFSDENLKMALKMALPLIAGQLAIQLNAVIDRSFASTLAIGTISALKYGNLLCVFINTLIATSIATVIYPKLSKCFADNKMDEFKAIIKNSLSVSIIVVTPLILGAIILSEPIIKLLFERGSFGTSNTLVTAKVFSLYAFGIMGGSIFEVLNRTFYAMKDSKTPTACYAFGMFLNIFLNFMFIDIWGANGLASATSISLTVIMCILFFLLRKKTGSFEFAYLLKLFAKSLLAGLSMAVVTYFSHRFFVQISSNNLLWKAILVFAPAGIGIIFYMVTLLLLKSEEVKFLPELCKKKITISKSK